MPDPRPDDAPDEVARLLAQTGRGPAVFEELLDLVERDRRFAKAWLHARRGTAEPDA